MPNVRDESLPRTKTDFVDENTRETAFGTLNPSIPEDGGAG